jgi:hypothetical protein
MPATYFSMAAFNYINTNDKRESPAMRLGLAQGAVYSEK